MVVDFKIIVRLGAGSGRLRVKCLHFIDVKKQLPMWQCASYVFRKVLTQNQNAFVSLHK